MNCHVARASWPALFLLASAALAQQNLPHAGYVYPAGGRQGATLEVTVGGQNLNAANNAYLSGDGVRVSIGDYARPMTPAQANMLREELQELNKKRTANPGSLTAAERARFEEIRAKLAKFVPRPPNPIRALDDARRGGFQAAKRCVGGRRT